MKNLRLEIRRILAENQRFFDDSEIQAQWDDTYERHKEKNSKIRKNEENFEYKVSGFDSRNHFAVLRNIKSGKSYAFYFAQLRNDALGRYSETSIGGEPVIDEETIERYVNENLRYLKNGRGIASWDTGDGDLVEIDQQLRERLQKDFGNSSSIIKALK